MNIGLVGASNVGKSTLFNRLIGQFRAIVTDIEGTTVDIINHKLNFKGIGDVMISDSPGLIDFSDEWPFVQKIIDKSDLILFVVDDSAGLTSKERNIFKYIMEAGKKDNTILIINKIDIKWKDRQYDIAIADYYELGLPNIIGVSAKNGYNISGLEDVIIELIEKTHKSKEYSVVHINKNTTPIAILGKPNAGKSTFLNNLVGENISKVDEVAGTTRDYIVGDFTFQKKHFTVFDTAGLRKKSKAHGLEKIANDKTHDMLKYIRPVVIFMIDVSKGISHRDMTILQDIQYLALPIIFCINKVDLMPKKGIKGAIKDATGYLDFAKHIPIMPLVADTGEYKEEILLKAVELYKETNKRVDTNELNKVIGTEFITRPPRFPKNKVCKILYITQVDINAPTFLVFVNHKIRANFSFKKRLENTIRKYFGFHGVSIVTRFKDRARKEDESEKTDTEE